MRQITNKAPVTVNISNVQPNAFIVLEAEATKYVLTYDPTQKRCAFTGGRNMWDSCAPAEIDAFLAKYLAQPRCKMFELTSITELADFLSAKWQH